MKSVVVTGATGFVGGHLVSRLLDIGAHVSIATRREIVSDSPFKSYPVGDINGSTDWTGAFEGVETVMHLAGIAHRRAQVQRNQADQYWSVNAQGTRKLAEAAAAAGVKRLIFISSIAVNGSTTNGRTPFRHDDEPAPQTPYGLTKLAAENALQEVSAAFGSFAIDVIRCPVVIGKGAPGNLSILSKAITRGLPLPFRQVNNSRMFLAIDDLIDFLVLRLDSNEVGWRCFTLASPDCVSTAQVVSMLADAAKSPARLFSLPPALIRAALVLARRREMANGLLDDLLIDTSLAHSRGWEAKRTIPGAIEIAFGIANQNGP